ncbi:glycosyltransferase [Synechococcales cyanobacterium C]|uniref:Glycosyltransferase n=1 Tax=Petrachloros mirabilis ULC683 TaxID=2781853 RepID=A0A8K1ZVQ4_9CYAN|nr:glycosyltransferase family 4 protein [Petrachloros mirabilis]NCJ05026.1 glycosyltransferase [Petrachloros mirabilis ULC683]
MNILLVSFYNPLGKGGFEKQTIGFLKELANQDNRIGCITFAKSDEKSTIHSSLVKSGLFRLGIYVLDFREDSHSLKAKLMFWLAINSSNFLSKYYSNLGQSIAFTIKKIRSQSSIDFIHIHGLKTAYIFPDCQENSFLIDLLDSFSLCEKRSLSYCLKKDRKHAFFSYINYLKILKIEKSLLKKYAKKCPFVMISEYDAKYLQSKSPKARIYTIAAATDKLDLISEESRLNKPEKKLVFCGFMNRLHNYDAFIWLVEAIMPLVVRAHPETKLEVTGFAIPKQFYQMQDHFRWLKVMPEVEDINSFMSQATLICWPFRYGAGIKTKILESMALGKAIVSTKIGVEAFTSSQTRGILIANTAESLADCINQLLANSKYRENMGRINLEIINSEFSWEKRAERYLQLYHNNIATES